MDFIRKYPDTQDIGIAPNPTQSNTDHESPPLDTNMKSVDDTSTEILPESLMVETEKEEPRKIYHLTADYKKSTYQTEQWNNVLSNGKHVRFEVTNYFYWGTFEIELSDNEKEEILKKTSIILNNHSGVSVESLDSGCDYSAEICNIANFTPGELKEIHRLLYLDPDDEESYTSDCDDVNEDVLEQNGWSMDETIYGMDTGCELECISD